MRGWARLQSKRDPCRREKNARGSVGMTTKCEVCVSWNGETIKRRNKTVIRKLAIIAVLELYLLSAGTASAQDWFKTGTGLGVTKARVAVPEFRGARSYSAGVRKNISRHAVGRPGVLRDSGTGQPQFLSAADAEPAERSKFRGMGGGAGEYVHAGVRKFVPATAQIWRWRDIYRTCTTRSRRRRCRRCIAGRLRTMARASWRISSRTTSWGN